MFCPNCGKYLDDRATFCTACQQDIIDIQQPQPAPKQERIYNYQSSNTYSSNRDNIRPAEGIAQTYSSGVKVDATNSIILSIFTTICCCLPLGAIALYFAATAGSAATQAEADKKLKNAQTLNIISIAIGVIGWIFVSGAWMIPLIPLGLY